MKKILLVAGVLTVLAACSKTNVETKESRQLAGAPYETEMDSRAEKALEFIRTQEKDLGEVTNYKRQIVAGVNHYFEFTKEGESPVEIVVYEDLDGNLKITSKQLLGAPYETEMDSRAKKALEFVRTQEKDLGEVTNYKRQIVAGVNHYFEFTKEGKPPIEIVVYEDLDGNLKITSKGVLE